MEKRQPPRLAIVVPCYNEEEGLKRSIVILIDLIGKMSAERKCSPDSFVVLVDDGSKDDTWAIIQQEQRVNPTGLVGIRLAANRGHQNALAAGLNYATDHSEASISIDADLQDDLQAMTGMLDRYMDGYEIVLGVKNKRIVDPLHKRITAVGFYKLIKVMGVKLQPQHADFRLLSAAAMRNLRQFPEYNLFLRGFPHLLHSKITTVHYDIKDRETGTSKYTLRKMISLALNGITSFSVFPLRLITVLGFIIFLISSILSIMALIDVLSGKSVPGWASITVPLYLLGGINMLCIGIVGEYIGKTYMESKRRPRYLIDTVLDSPSNGVIYRQTYPATNSVS